jgi:hypothetical protein
MKAIVQLVAALTLAMIVVAAWVFAAGDRRTLVPPPDAVAEGFLRQLAARRYDRVESYVSRTRRSAPAWSAATLRRRFEPLWRYTGQVNQVDAELVSIDGDRARAVASAQGDLAEARVLVELTREHGLWKVDGYSTNPMPPAEDREELPPARSPGR